MSYTNNLSADSPFRNILLLICHVSLRRQKPHCLPHHLISSMIRRCLPWSIHSRPIASCFLQLYRHIMPTLCQSHAIIILLFHKGNIEYSHVVPHLCFTIVAKAEEIFSGRPYINSQIPPANCHMSII